MKNINELLNSRDDIDKAFVADYCYPYEVVNGLPCKYKALSPLDLPKMVELATFYSYIVKYGGTYTVYSQTKFGENVWDSHYYPGIEKVAFIAMNAGFELVHDIKEFYNSMIMFSRLYKALELGRYNKNG